MAKLQESGSILAHCPDCQGTRSMFEWRVSGGTDFGKIVDDYNEIYYGLFRCVGCKRGALGVIQKDNRGEKYLSDFYPEAKYYSHLPSKVPKNIEKEFREAEISLNNRCFRAAAALFRSVLDKTMRANGYDTRKNSNLYKQIEAAAQDGVITPTRKKKAHDEIRVLGNDVLHDDWREVSKEEIITSRHYIQRILEDLYDDRETVLNHLRDAGRKPLDDQCEENEEE